jgi:hypothetical protein
MTFEITYKGHNDKKSILHPHKSIPPYKMRLSKMLFLSLCSIALISVSCKKTSDTPAAPYVCTTCSTAPEALAANNSSSKGIYKGILIGSSGTIKFDVLNAGTTITAVMVIDGITVNLTSSITWVGGQPYVAPFTGTLNGSAVTINFSVDASGGTPVITSSNIPGHPSAQFTLVKETSVALVEAFEGTYSTTLPETGTFNILVSRVLLQWGGASRKTNGTSNGSVDGTLDANGKMTESGGVVIGTLTGDNIAGSSLDGNGITVTITGKRTL